MPNAYSNLLERQRNYYRSRITRPYRFRTEQLGILHAAIKKHEGNICQALHADLGKAPQESYMTELGPALAELRFQKKHLREWMRPQSVPGMIYSFPSSGKILAEPRGTVLIIAPWNYPFWLSVVPLMGALAAGNCIVLKPSELAPHTSAALKKMFDENFPVELISVVEGDAAVSTQLLELPPDHIFFTGSIRVGKIVAEAASKNLVPYTLELGGKSPCIVDASANLALAAKRMAWGKTITAGQTCVAPDYLLVHKSIREQLVDELKKAFSAFYPSGALQSADYPRIVDEKKFMRLKNMMNDGRIISGGRTDVAQLRIEPTIMTDVKEGSPLAEEEIFGPLLPVFSFDQVNEVIDHINQRPQPLALYVFSSDKKFTSRLLEETSYGGALVNDSIEHLGNPHLPFGGVGASGMGAYHGKWSFDTFTHYKAMMRKQTWIDLPFRYPPFTNLKMKVLKTFLR